jgi:hypothetical protein
MSGPDRTILRNARPEIPYTQICNGVLRDPNLTLETRGFLVSIYTLPIDWEFSKKWAMKQFKIGEQKIERILKEAAKFGYLDMSQRRSTKGRFSEIVYRFTDLSGVFVDSDRTVKTAPTDEENINSPHREKRGGGSPHREKHPPIQKKDSTNELSNLKTNEEGNSKNTNSKNTPTRPEVASPVKAKRGRPPKQLALPTDADAESAAVMAERALDEEGIALFNEAALKVGVRPVVALTSARRRDLRQMRTDLGAKGVDWRLVFANLGKSTFPTKSGFVLNDFDHVMKYYVQLVEGSFCEVKPVDVGDDKIWRFRVQRWAKFMSMPVDERTNSASGVYLAWNSEYGPEPYEAGCQVPAGILAEFSRSKSEIVVKFATSAAAIWRTRIRKWMDRDAGRASLWPSKWGPMPGQPNCTIPDEILKEFAHAFQDMRESDKTAKNGG